jgi:succinoglycan biosynthesis protein ExoO
MTAAVSIIMPTFNVAPYVARAISSALAQEGADVEVIVVDNGSTDGTWDIISALTDTRVKKKRIDKNVGPSAARNAAIEMAEGAWIAVLDGDDALEPARISRCLARARALNADIVVDNLTCLREDNGTRHPMFTQEQLDFDVLTLADFIKGNARFLVGRASLGYMKPVFNADFLKKHALSYDPAITIGEDYLILAEALAAGAICAVEKTAGYLYTIRKGSISQRLSAAHIDRIAACDEKFLRRHTLDGAARAAQAIRAAALQDARAYVQIIDSMKRGSAKDTARAVLSRPLAARYLWLPLAARLQRTLGRIRHARKDAI